LDRHYRTDGGNRHRGVKAEEVPADKMIF
jgi:hypothetical protein